MMLSASIKSDKDLTRSLYDDDFGEGDIVRFDDEDDASHRLDSLEEHRLNDDEDDALYADVEIPSSQKNESKNVKFENSHESPDVKTSEPRSTKLSVYTTTRSYRYDRSANNATTADSQNATLTSSNSQQSPSQTAATQDGALDPDKPDKSKIFVGALNWDTTDESMYAYFSQFGEVTSCVVMKDQNTGRSRGFGFLTFSDEAAVDKIVNMTHVLDGKVVDPKRAIPREEQDKTEKIFVGGIGPDVTEAIFRDYFVQFGKVIDATLMIGRDTGKPRGFGFITFETSDGVEAVLEFQKKEQLKINGKMVEARRATPKTKPAPVAINTLIPVAANTTMLGNVMNMGGGMGMNMGLGMGMGMNGMMMNNRMMATGVMSPNGYMENSFNMMASPISPASPRAMVSGKFIPQRHNINHAHPYRRPSGNQSPASATNEVPRTGPIRIGSKSSSRPSLSDQTELLSDNLTSSPLSPATSIGTASHMSKQMYVNSPMHQPSVMNMSPDRSLSMNGMNVPYGMDSTSQIVHSGLIGSSPLASNSGWMGNGNGMMPNEMMFGNRGMLMGNQMAMGGMSGYSEAEMYQMQLQMQNMQRQMRVRTNSGMRDPRLQAISDDMSSMMQFPYGR